MLAGNPGLFSPPELQLLTFNTMAERASACEGDCEKYMLEGTVRAVMEMKNCGMEEAKALTDQYAREGWSVQKFYRQMRRLDRAAHPCGQDAGLRDGRRDLRRAEASF